MGCDCQWFFKGSLKLCNFDAHRTTMKAKQDKEWFANWFDSPWYHVLYKGRDQNEAKQFISNLLQYLHLPENARVLDLACGKGRHSITLHKHGLDVTGLDLSPHSIACAQRFEATSLHFQVHDMREPIQLPPFEAVFNLFTSFGYFDADEDHINTLRSVHNALVHGGRFIFDYLNTPKLLNQLVPEESKTVDGITFHLERKLEDGFIHKHIRFDAEGKHYDFEEKVRAFAFEDLQKFFSATGLQIIDTFGDYSLNPYDTAQSDRLILVATPTEK